MGFGRREEYVGLEEGSRDDPSYAAVVATLAELVEATVVAIACVDECHVVDLDYYQ